MDGNRPVEVVYEEIIHSECGIQMHDSSQINFSQQSVCSGRTIQEKSEDSSVHTETNVAYMATTSNICNISAVHDTCIPTED